MLLESSELLDPLDPLDPVDPSKVEPDEIPLDPVPEAVTPPSELPRVGLVETLPVSDVSELSVSDVSLLELPLEGLFALLLESTVDDDDEVADADPSFDVPVDLVFELDGVLFDVPLPSAELSSPSLVASLLPLAPLTLLVVPSSELEDAAVDPSESLSSLSPAVLVVPFSLDFDVLDELDEGEADELWPPISCWR